MAGSRQPGIDIEGIEADITTLEVDAIVNAANSSGEMGGGVAGVIRRKGGAAIEREAMARTALACADAERLESVAFPGMGTGVGRVSPGDPDPPIWSSGCGPRAAGSSRSSAAVR